MELASLPRMLPGCEVRGSLAGEVSGVSYNSKTTKPGELFFCLRGNFLDGHQFAGEAVLKGARAVVVEEFLDISVPQIRVADSRRALAQVSRHFYGDPGTRLGLVGVTGTNGKTTTTFYIRSVLERLGAPVGLIGTVYNQLGGEPEPSEMTTPESADLARLFSRAVENGCRWLVMEVSSHALGMNRVDPADFGIAVVTNITRDHFEYHKTFEHYLASKARLIREMAGSSGDRRISAAVLNADDPHVASLAPEAPVPVLTFGLMAPADVMATDLQTTVTGSQFRLHLPGTTPTRINLPLPGVFNIANALAAAAVGRAAGVPLADIVAGLESLTYVPGRAESIREGQDFHVIVDFAHNPDALAKVVSLRPDRPGGRTILVFGAEGGKDRGKRPQMGAAARGADFVIVTSDNMHKEEPVDVAAQIEAGLEGHPHQVILDRREAIARALEIARTGDLVIVAGKGHEQTWVFGGKRLPFDDRAVVRELLRAGGRTSGSRPAPTV